MKQDNYEPQLNVRKVMNLKQVDDQWLADRINISRTSVNMIINGHTDPKLSRLYQIADALDVSILELFG